MWQLSSRVPRSSARWPRISLRASRRKNPRPQSTKKPKPKADDPSLDDALLKDLDNELLEGVGDPKARPKPKPAESKGHEPTPASETDEEAGMAPDSIDPLTRISQEMRRLEELVAKRVERRQAEQLQRRVVEELDALIEQAERQAESQSATQATKRQKTQQRESVAQPKLSTGEPGEESNKPASDSTDRLGQQPKLPPTPEEIKQLLKGSWGHLPDRAREQMLQNPPEKFVPQYELMIEALLQTTGHAARFEMSRR